VAEKLSDRVKHFFTINEFFSFVEADHRGMEVSMPGGAVVRLEMAPGLTLSPGELAQVRHPSVLAHGMAVRAIRAKGKSGTKVGPAESISVLVPLVETPEHIKAAQTATREANAPYLTVMLEGKYTDTYLRKAGKDAPKFTDDDLKVINSPLDFVGINVYRPMNYLVASDEAPGWREIQFSKARPKMVARWRAFDPVALYWDPKFVHSLWGPKEIHITENGCATYDELTADGNIFDTDRIMFLRAYLTQLQRATAEGVPVKGYFQWSTMDNFEWNAGLSGNRYGLVYATLGDFKSRVVRVGVVRRRRGKRTPR
jgi:beta-glucosidase